MQRDDVTPGVAASVVIAAHNEEIVIDRCLAALLAQETQLPLEIVVVANGCSDRTAEVAKRPGVRVVDLAAPGKAGALNAGDRAASGFPRIYLDADIVVPPGGIAAVLDRLADDPGTLAVVPRRRLVTAGRPWPVRAYFSINQRLPVFRNGLFGRGMITVSEEGRRRFGEFPELIADDLFLDSQFSDDEKAEAAAVEVAVETPFTTGDLLRRLVRVRRGNAELRTALAGGDLQRQVRPSDRFAWLREVAREPRLALSGLAYAAITTVAALRARRAPATGREWGRDESTRRPGAGTGAPQ